jgi:hypothetical protein
MQLMAAVKEWLLTKELCSGDGGTAKKVMAEGTNQYLL